MPRDSLPPIYRPRLHAVDRSAPERAKDGGRAFSDLAAISKELSATRAWTFEGAYEGSPVAVMVGPEKRNKSWALTQKALATITGGKWLGRFRCMRPGPVIYLDGEYGPHEFARRAARVARGMGHEPATVLGELYYYYSRDLLLTAESDALHWVAREAHRISPRLIIVDPFRNHLDGDENSALDVVYAISICATIRDKQECSVFLAHHLNRAGTSSGSRALQTRSDLVIDGTDEENPWYTTTSRTMRKGDLLSSPFTILINHIDDQDDTVAKTIVGCRFQDETAASRELSATALKVLDVLRKGDASTYRIREALRINGHVASRALQELRDAGRAEPKAKRWTLSTTEFFNGLGQGAAR